MARGRPPAPALQEAKTIALRQGTIGENTKGRGLLYDFTIHFMVVTIEVSIRWTVVSDNARIFSSGKKEIARPGSGSFAGLHPGRIDP